MQRCSIDKQKTFDPVPRRRFNPAKTLARSSLSRRIIAAVFPPYPACLQGVKQNTNTTRRQARRKNFPCLQLSRSPDDITGTSVPPFCHGRSIFDGMMDGCVHVPTLFEVPQARTVSAPQLTQLDRDGHYEVWVYLPRDNHTIIPIPSSLEASLSTCTCTWNLKRQPKFEGGCDMKETKDVL